MTYGSPQNQIIATFGTSDRAKERLTTVSQASLGGSQSTEWAHSVSGEFLVNQSTLLSGHRIGACICKNTVFEMPYNSFNLMTITF